MCRWLQAGNRITYRWRRNCYSASIIYFFIISLSLAVYAAAVKHNITMARSVETFRTSAINQIPFWSYPSQKAWKCEQLLSKYSNNTSLQNAAPIPKWLFLVEDLLYIYWFLSRDLILFQVFPLLATIPMVRQVIFGRIFLVPCGLYGSLWIRYMDHV